ncbi:transporter substrate-binding domain-containing protein [Rheinheimera muenzenbergensis]|uniref:Transporter substrate-binding domain-containing protein n=1 Tax=Rheinheimera muenzenbergensis TaxID=1193628 RepID=A0ABU8C1D4_9GAMM
MRLLWSGLLLCLSTALSSAEVTALRVAIPDYPPYTVLAQGEFSGPGYDAFISIMTEAGLQYQLIPVPNFGRALIDMQNQQIDMFFLATENAERSHVAQFSLPVITTDWSWVWLKARKDVVPGSEQFRQDALVSAQMNSNIFSWLQQHKYKITAGTNNIHGLFKLLDFNRVDAIMLPSDVATALIAKQQLDASRYNMQQELTLPFGFYVSNNYLSLQPDFLQRLNAAISRYHDNAARAEPAPNQ